MDDEPRSQPLDYRGIAPRYRVPEDAESRCWRLWRILFRVGVILLLMPVTFYLGPNLINFGKLTSLSPADFVAEVQGTCVPTVRAMKEYQIDTGHLPSAMEDLVPKYLASLSERQFIDDGSFKQLAFRGMNHMITYDFTTSAEGWSVYGPFARGPIPLPPVTIAPATRPILPPK